VPQRNHEDECGFSRWGAIEMGISTTKILGALRALEQGELDCKKSISRANHDASHYRLTGARFSRYADAPANPEMKQIDLSMAEYFKDRADTGERSAAAGLQRLTEIAGLKQRWLLLLERFENLNAATNIKRTNEKVV
jgi:hypothetical protein